MRSRLLVLTRVSVPLLLALGACTTTYTEADLEAQEARKDREAQVEEQRDREVGAEGGVGAVENEEDEAWADADSDL